MSISKKEKKAIQTVAKTIKAGDLYKALHCVGDDPIKSCIEDTLRETLSKETFNEVVAVFKLMTDDDIYEEYFDENE